MTDAARPTTAHERMARRRAILRAAHRRFEAMSPVHRAELLRGVDAANAEASHIRTFRRSQ